MPGGVHTLEDGLLDENFEIAIVLVKAADANFQIFIQLLAIVSLGEDGDIPEVQGNGVRAVVAHGANKLAVTERVVAGELDLADFYLGPFIDLKNEDDRVARSDTLELRRNLSKLPPVLAKQILQHHFRFFDLGGIERAFHRQADYALLEAVENVGLGNGMCAFVADAANHRPLLDVEDDDFGVGPVRRILDTQLDVFEELRVPQRLKIAAQRFFVVDVALTTEDSGGQRVAADASVAHEIDALDDERLLAGLWLLIAVSSVCVIFRNRFERCQIQPCGEQQLDTRSCGTARCGRRRRLSPHTSRSAKPQRCEPTTSVHRNTKRQTNPSSGGR